MPTAFIITLRYSLEWVQESKSQQRDGLKRREFELPFLAEKRFSYTLQLH